MSFFKLPDLGEGLPEAEIAEWFVQEGQKVKVDQPLVAVETAKALVDIPSPQAGVISKLFGQAGDIIETGDPLLEFADEPSLAAENQLPAHDNKSQANKTKETKTDQGTVVGAVPVSGQRHQEQAISITAGAHKAAAGVKATPAVRALAHRLDVDLSVVTPSGPNGTIMVSDVERVVAIFKQAGPLEKLKGVRRAMAYSMSKAHAEVVLVTINEDADIETWRDNQDITSRLIRAMIVACEKQPALNAWYDSHSVGRRLIKQVHLGIAVDNEDGLFVPVIRDAEQLSLPQLREKIDDLKLALKNRSLSPEDLRGNTITLSNFGHIGGRYADPVVVPPTVAILGAGAVRDDVIAVKRELEIHRRIPLSLSFDHRAVTGAEASRFLMAVIADLLLAD
ncbi:MAG: 2-oxo acid dehydrogenase subunit E2 [Gammaproteobacteria bacterium]|nr:2-oxo acid dehydrogenase subunit E2 [Gammaproteobacteria bacterium]